ncbi:hypothetical protein BC629DRAFT_1174887 [Irpex lacteus]|nr:hypothetical protein BC629DRAFT_1174887 [Irpex lacteus]
MHSQVIITRGSSPAEQLRSRILPLRDIHSNPPTFEASSHISLMGIVMDMYPSDLRPILPSLQELVIDFEEAFAYASIWVTTSWLYSLCALFGEIRHLALRLFQWKETTWPTASLSHPCRRDSHSLHSLQIAFTFCSIYRHMAFVSFTSAISSPTMRHTYPTYSDILVLLWRPSR